MDDSELYTNIDRGPYRRTWWCMVAHGLARSQMAGHCWLCGRAVKNITAYLISTFFLPCKTDIACLLGFILGFQALPGPWRCFWRISGIAFMLDLDFWRKHLAWPLRVSLLWVSVWMAQVVHLEALKNIHGRSFREGLQFFWLQSASKAGAWCFRPEEDRPEFSIFCSLASRRVIFWGWTFKDCGRTSTVHSGHHFWLVFYFHRRRHLSVARLSPVSQAEPR